MPRQAWAGVKQVMDRSLMHVITRLLLHANTPHTPSALSELQRIRDPYLSLAASLPARGVTDTLAPRTLRSDHTGIRTEHL